MKRKKKLIPAPCLAPGFAYTRSDQQGDGYLQAKFAPLIKRLRDEREAADREQAAKCIAHIGKIRKQG